MIFGKIDYINLLPFHIYLKRSNLTNAMKKSCEFKKSYPADINKKFLLRRVDGAVISSIESNKKNIKTLPIGIVAKKNVTSVIVKKNTKTANDPHSATSNMLAKILNIQGEVYIGDVALKLYLDSPNDYIDLAKVWNDKYNLPFVFAVLCVNNHFSIYKKLSNNFKNKRIKIPQYILQKYANERKISTKEIKQYLTLISYKIENKEKKGLKLFLKKSREFRQNKSFNKSNTIKMV